MHGHLSSGTRCLNFGLSLYLHHFSVCIQAVKVLEMLHTSADASVHGLIEYSLHIKSKELTHFFTKWPFSFEKLCLFSHSV